MESGVKIVQIMGMDNDPCWQGRVLALGSDGVVYISVHTPNEHRWEVYIPLRFK